MRQPLILPILLLFSITSLAQPDCEVDKQRIKHPKIVAQLEELGLRIASDFAALSASCYLPEKAIAYFQHKKSFFIKGSLREVWNTYKQIHPRDAWSGKIISFGLLYAKSCNSFSYLNDDYQCAEAGQIIFLNLRLLGGLLNLAVAHEIQQVDDENHCIRFCYLANGNTKGSQSISLHSAGEGFVEVRHLTYYRSGSDFRDKYLYPGLHEKAISEFHANVARQFHRLKEVRVGKMDNFAECR